MSFSKFIVGAAALALVSAALPASAAVTVTYSDRASFDVAAGPLSTETFESCAVNSHVDSAMSAGHASPCGSIVPGVRFAPAPDAENYIAPPGQTGNPTIALGVNSPPYAEQLVDFIGSNVFAFGADLFQNYGAGEQSGDFAPFQIRVHFIGGDPDAVFGVGVASGGGTFFGFTSDTAIDKVGIAQTNGFAVIDNASFSTSGAPEPTAWAIMLTGFSGLGALLRRRRGRPLAA